LRGRDFSRPANECLTNTAEAAVHMIGLVLRLSAHCHVARKRGSVEASWENIPTQMNATIPERKAITEDISGLIERITFHNEENGFCALRVKVRGQRDEVTVLGSLPSVSAGEWLEAEGWWVRDKEHGLQFKARLMKTVTPATVEGIERYLSSGWSKASGQFWPRNSSQGSEATNTCAPRCLPGVSC
jgi:hypothetical protein